MILGYLAALGAIGLWARRRSRPGQEDFFLAGRSLGGVVLFFTMAATNFSSFTVFGFAGAGYRIGYAYYPIMAFGTAFMALSFLFIGIPVWRASRATGAVTPPEFIAHRFGHAPLRIAYLAVMVVFTLPYLAIQPMGAGYALQGLLGIPYVWGAVLVTVVGVGYVLLAGMRGDAWTDALQGIVMLVAMVVVFLGITRALGGFSAANAATLKQAPELFARPGGGGTFSVGIWFSYMALWLFCDPMFPQLFQRFMAARSAKALRTSALLYPLVTSVLFFIPVTVGVLGRSVLPGLSGSETDQILPLLVARLLPGWVGALAIACGLAALMSTMDSQLLTLSAMLVRDVRQLAGRPAETRFPWPRLAILLLAAAGLALALRPLGTILAIATETFTGLAVLFPVTVAAIYWPRANPWAGFASILAGEVLVALYHFKLVPTFGLLPVVPVIVATAAVLVVGSLLWPGRARPPLARVARGGWRWVAGFGILFLLSNDFCNWQDARPGWLGLPNWLWYHAALVAALFIMMLLYFLAAGRLPAEPAPDENEPGGGDSRKDQDKPESEPVGL